MEAVSIRSDERPREELRVAPTPAQRAWLALVPCALVTVAAVLVLGPAVGRLLFSPHGEQLWPREAPFVFGEPEPVEHGRFLVALLGPALLVAAILAPAPRLALRPAALRLVTLAGQALLIAAVFAATLLQRGVDYASLPPRWQVFTPLTLVAAAAFAALLSSPRAGGRLAAVVRFDGRAVRAGCLAVAAVATALWLLPAVVTERVVTASPFPDLPPWAMGDAYAVLDGRTPLVDFHALYGQLWGYVAALPMALLQARIGVFSVTMACASGLALLAVYGILRRVARSAPLALALYLPFLATSLFSIDVPAGTGVIGGSVSNSEIYSVWPMRYSGPLLVAWLTARHLAGAAPRRSWPLFLVAGLVAINNLEFGLGALVGMLAALACAPSTRSRGALRRLAVEGSAGFAGALLLVTLLTLARSGELPRPGLLGEFPHLFGVLGLAELPTPAIGFHLTIYATLAGALAVAAARVRRRASDVVLSGMLAWSGVFGLLAGSYFMGRADPLKLAALLPAWALALTLLVVVALRALAARDWRRPSLAELLVLLGFGAMICSLAQLPSPSAQLERLRPAPEATALYAQPEAHQLVDRVTRPGEHVAILIPMGHRIADDLGLVNVSPYAFLDEIATRAQFRTLLDAIRDEHAHKLFVLVGHLAREHRRALAHAGFTRRAGFAHYEWWADRSVGR
jgi:hypothetical protein